jgi:hypothetical protein
MAAAVKGSSANGPTGSLAAVLETMGNADLTNVQADVEVAGLISLLKTLTDAGGNEKAIQWVLDQLHTLAGSSALDQKYKDFIQKIDTLPKTATGAPTKDALDGYWTSSSDPKTPGPVDTVIADLSQWGPELALKGNGNEPNPEYIFCVISLISGLASNTTAQIENLSQAFFGFQDTYGDGFKATTVYGLVAGMFLATILSGSDLTNVVSAMKQATPSTPDTDAFYAHMESGATEPDNSLNFWWYEAVKCLYGQWK